MSSPGGDRMRFACLRRTDGLSPRRQIGSCSCRPSGPPFGDIIAKQRARAVLLEATDTRGASIMLTAAKPNAAPSIPFDSARLDRLLEEAGIDVLLATSKHNVQYLLGGHRAFFFDYMDAMGISRYLPVVVYPKGAPDKAGFFGHRLENHQREVTSFWTPETQTTSSGSVDVMKKATDYLRKLGVKTRRIAVELAFMPMDSGGVLRAA